MHFIYSLCKSIAEQRAVGQEDAVVLSERASWRAACHCPGHWETAASLAPSRVHWPCAVGSMGVLVIQ